MFSATFVHILDFLLVMSLLRVAPERAAEVLCRAPEHRRPGCACV